jgi:DNA-binding transcriptional regulator YdaS (Cro superfamily)
MTAIERAIKIVGVPKLSKELGVSEAMISKAKIQGYGTADWFPIIFKLTKKQVTLEDLHADRINNKLKK